MNDLDKGSLAASIARRPGCASRAVVRHVLVVQIAISASRRAEDEHFLSRPRQLARARQRVADRAELSCVVGCSRRSEVLGLVAVVRVR